MLKALLPSWLRDRAVHRNAVSAAAFRLDVGMLTDEGCVRPQNEDCILFCRPADPDVLEAKGVLAVVADGMGGHQAGEVASRLAVDAIRLGYFEAPAGRKHDISPGRALRDAFLHANASVYRLSRQQDRCRGMGTTATALVVKGNLAFYAHIGDSRIYRIRDRECRQLSVDHTVVQQMLQDGLIEPGEAEAHPERNVLTRALGTHPEIEVDLVPEPLALQPGDCFLLCSDGLYDPVRDDELLDAVRSTEPQAACRILVDKARERGGHDNISVIVVRVATDEGSAETPITRV